MAPLHFGLAGLADNHTIRPFCISSTTVWSLKTYQDRLHSLRPLCNNSCNSKVANIATIMQHLLLIVFVPQFGRLFSRAGWNRQLWRNGGAGAQGVRKKKTLILHKGTTSTSVSTSCLLGYWVRPAWINNFKYTVMVRKSHVLHFIRFITRIFSPAPCSGFSCTSLKVFMSGRGTNFSKVQ